MLNTNLSSRKEVIIIIIVLIRTRVGPKLIYLLSLTEITLDQTKNELEKIKQEKIDLETKLQLFKSSDVSILTTAKNRMEKKYHEKDLELAKTIGKKYAIVAVIFSFG